MFADQIGPTAASAGTHCPGCWSPAAPGTQFCPACGLWLAGPQTAELHWIEAELQRVDAARSWLLSRRAVLLDQLMVGSTSPAEPRPRPVLTPPGADRTIVERTPRRRPEISGRNAARLLLAAGAGLLVIAVTIFTIAGWSRLGEVGRAMILIAVTALILGAAPALRRRGLAATAETLAGLALALSLADGYLVLRITALPWARGGWFAAAAGTLLLAVAWAAYGTVSRLTVPKVAAIGAGQLPALLLAAGLSASAGRWFPRTGAAGFALILDAAVSVALAGRAGWRLGAAGKRAAAVAAVACWLFGVLVAVTMLAGYGLAAGPTGPSWPIRAWVSATMLAAAAAAIAGPRVAGDIAGLARPACLLAGALLAVGSAVPLLSLAPAGWALGVVAGCGWAVSAAALTAQHRPRRAAPSGRLGGLTQSIARKPCPEIRNVPSGASAAVAEPRTGRTGAAVADPAMAELGRGDLVAAGGAAMLALTAMLAVPVALARLLPAAGSPIWPGAHSAALVLALAALSCWLAPERSWRARATVLRPAGLAAAALAAAAIPAAISVPAWLALAVLTAGAVGLLAASVLLGEPAPAAVAAAAGTVLAAGAAARSLTTPDRAVTELAVLTVAFAVVTARSRRPFGIGLGTAAGLGAAAGLAWSAAWAAGWPAAQAALAGLAVAIAATATSTWLRQQRRTRATEHGQLRPAVLDGGAVLIAAISLVTASTDLAIFSLIAVTVAAGASAAAWRRDGHARTVALAVCGCAAAAGIMAQGGPLAAASLVPARIAAHPWHGDTAGVATMPPAGLAFAVIVAACGVAALVSAVGAVRGCRASCSAAAVGLTLVAFLAAEAAGLAYWQLAGLLLGLTIGLAVWAAVWSDPAPAWAALLTAGLTLAWSLAAPLPTVLALAVCLAGCVFLARQARLAVTGKAAAALAGPAAAALAAAAVLAVGGTAGQAGLAVLDVIVAAVGRDRRRAGWALLALLEIAWCAALAAAGVSAPEPYTVPAAVAALVPLLRRTGPALAGPRRSSWLTWGPGLALALIPSLVACWLPAGWLNEFWLSPGWLTPSWIRPVALASAAAAVAVFGARARLQAPLLAGAAVAVLAAAREMAPAVTRLIGVLPGWVPVAVLGAGLLWAGASYEARIRNLRALRRLFAAMN